MDKVKSMGIDTIQTILVRQQTSSVTTNSGFGWVRRGLYIVSECNTVHSELMQLLLRFRRVSAFSFASTSDNQSIQTVWRRSTRMRAHCRTTSLISSNCCFGTCVLVISNSSITIGFSIGQYEMILLFTCCAVSTITMESTCGVLNSQTTLTTTAWSSFSYTLVVVRTATTTVNTSLVSVL